MIERYLEMKDGHRLFLRTWDAVENPVATLHINHGMAEHSLRYDDFARYMNRLGFIVYAQDHRGHGLTKEEEERGWFGTCGGWDLVVGDSIAVDRLIMNEWENLPHFLMGHSMGSFITRCAITKESDDLAAVIVMGSGASQGLIGRIGRGIAARHVKKHGSKMPDHTMTKLSFGGYNKKFKPVKTDSDWLSRDEAQVKKYIDDPLCGFVCSSQFFCDLLDGIEMANSPSLAKKISPALPMLVISGADDPVGGFGKGVEKVYRMYKGAGVRDVELKLFEKDRHEILNELDKADVYKYISDYLIKVLNRTEGK